MRYRRVVGNEEEKIRKVKTRNKGRADTKIIFGKEKLRLNCKWDWE